MNTKEVICPECEQRLKLGTLHRGQRVICTECESSLTVVSVNPVELESTVRLNRSAGQKKKSHYRGETPCPECDTVIKLGMHAREGQQVMCPGCKITLEVVNTSPLELDVAFITNLKYTNQHKFGNSRDAGRKSGKTWR